MVMTAAQGPRLTVLAVARCLKVVFACLLLALLLAACGGTGQAVNPTPTPLPPQPAVEKPTYTVQRGGYC